MRVRVITLRYDDGLQGLPQTGQHPVTCVSWHDAQAFCEWLTRKERAEGRIGSNQRYRLPRDWEWSVAVGLNEPRGGTPKEKARKDGRYPWGTEQMPPPAAWGNYAGEESRIADTPSGWGVIAGWRDRHPRTSPVGEYGARHGALCDLGGNVWEWCEDTYDGITMADADRVLRGGSWNVNDSRYLLSSYRFNARPGIRLVSNGFRVVLSGSSP